MYDSNMNKSIIMFKMQEQAHRLCYPLTKWYIAWIIYLILQRTLNPSIIIELC